MGKIGFTPQERKIILFLMVMLALGAGVNLFKHYKGDVFESPEKRKELLQKFRELTEQAEVADSIEASRAQQKRRENSINDSQVKININTAPAELLQKLPHIGPVLAERIIEYRVREGKFRNVEDITNVKGIGENIFSKIQEQLCIE